MNSETNLDISNHSKQDKSEITEWWERINYFNTRFYVRWTNLLKSKTGNYSYFMTCRKKPTDCRFEWYRTKTFHELKE